MHERFIARLAALAVGALVATTANSQDKVELKLSHYLPPVHGLHTDFMEPWAKDLEKCTNGKVTVRVSPGTSSLGNAANQLDQVQSGVVDIAFGLVGNPRGRLPRTGLIEMPFMIETADVGSRTLWVLYPKYLKDEYKGLKVLALMTHNGGLIHTRDKKVEKIEDLRGLRIRTPSPQVSAALTMLGATPVGMPPAQAYESLDKGVIDGAAFPWDPVKAFKLDEVTKYHTDARFYVASFWFAMNEKKYNSLPADVKKCIDQASGDALIAKFQGWWDKWDKAGLEAAKARNSTIVTLTPAERERWRQSLGQAYNKQILELEGSGVTNAREIYLEMQKTAAGYAKK